MSALPEPGQPEIRVPWTDTALDGEAVAAGIAAETDLDRLRDMLARTRSTGDLRWTMALCDRIAALSALPADKTAQVWAHLGARDFGRVRDLLANLPVAAPTRERWTLHVNLAEAEADAETLVRLRRQQENPAPGDEVGLLLREVSVRLARGDIEGVTRILAEARTLGAPAATVAELEVRLSLLAEGPAKALAALDERSGVLAPSDDVTRALRLRLMNARGRWGEAFELALGWMPDDPTRPVLPTDDLLAQTLHAAMMADRLPELTERLRVIEARLPGVPALVETLCICAIEDDDHLLTAEMMDKMRGMNRWRWLALALRNACHAGAIAEVDALRGLLRSEGCYWPGPDVMTALFAYYFEVTAERITALLEEMMPLFNRSFEDPGLQALRLRLQIGLSREEDARRDLAAMPPGLRACAELKPFEMYMAAHDGDVATADEGWRRWIVDTAPIATDARASYPQERVVRFEGQPDAILCFVCVFNGIEYVDWFLDHYRRLGVDHFFFCDNASTDGTAERLLEQPDVSLFHAPDSFAASGCGIFWINHLMRRFGVGHWCLHVDMDEALVFPMLDHGRDLHDLTRYLSARGHGCTESMMIDMVPPGFPGQVEGGSASFEQCLHFDPDLVSMPSELPPYRFIKGGVRSRMTGRSLLMTKSPLVRMNPDFAYLVNNHHHTHLPVSDVTTALLHYKFIGAYGKRFAEAIARREHFQGARFYRQLVRSLDSQSDGMSADALVAYTGPSQLVSLGLLRSSPCWDGKLPE